MDGDTFLCCVWQRYELVGGERELRELDEALYEDKISQKTFRWHQIEWNFNPTSAPHFGGVFKAILDQSLILVQIPLT